MLRMGISLGVMLLGLSTVQAEEIRLGYVNVERVLRESAPAQRAAKRIEKEFGPRRQEIEKLAAQLRALQTAMEKDGLKLEELRAKEREFNALNQTLQRMQREYREDLSLRNNEELAAVLERSGKVIRTLAETEHFDLVVQEAVYFAPRIDLTDRVLQALDEEEKANKTDNK